MSAIAILNIVLVVVVSAGIVSFLGWSIVADKTRIAARAGRERIPARANTARPRRSHRGLARSFS
jgi:hypothetical protein